MSVVVRLRGLPAIADSFDIRQFCCGLNIPRGGVFITGGNFGEAYIVFSTYEDARYALTLSGRLLKNSPVYLVYSNEEEMRHALDIYQTGLRASTSASYNLQFNSRDSERSNPAIFSYIYIHGMPVKVTKVEIREFFKGLLVEDVLFLKFINGIRNGNAIVKFGRSTDASEGLKLNNLLICGSPAMLKLSNEVEWNKNGGENVPKRRRRSRSPPRLYSSERRRGRSRSPVTRSRSPVRRRRRSSSFVREYNVHIINLSYRAEKRDIKKFFFDLDMKDSQINFLVDKEGKRTREAFATFTTEKDYKRALGLHNDTFKGHKITILPISRAAMLMLIERMKVRVCKDDPSKKTPSRSSKPQRYLYLRNFSFHITKADVQKFFTVQIVEDDDIFLLQDNKGVGLGEALVKFANEREATKAETQNKETYFGIKILLSRITDEEMKALKEANQVTDSMVTEAEDMPDFTSDAIPEIISNVEEPAPQKTNGESAALDSSDVGMRSDSESVPLADKESESTSATLVQETPTEEGVDDANGGDEEATDVAEETKNSAVTLLFIRNLPASVTVAEILDFFHDYKVSSVNLKNIEKGVATVRMQNYAEAESAISALNKKEVGLKQVFLSLF